VRRLAYLVEESVTPPLLTTGPDPLLRWEQRRTKLRALTLVLSLTIGEDGVPYDIFIVSPVGMGIDDEVADAVAKWQFKPGMRQKQPCSVHARVIVDFAALNASPTFPLR
jgi:hypothetical protein